MLVKDRANLEILLNEWNGVYNDEDNCMDEETFLFVSLYEKDWCVIEVSQDEGLWIVKCEGCEELNEDTLHDKFNSFYGEIIENNRSLDSDWMKDKQFFLNWLNNRKCEVYCWF